MDQTMLVFKKERWMPFGENGRFGLLLLAAFLADSVWFGDALTVYFTGRPVHPAVHMLYLGLTVLAAAAVLLLWLRKTGHEKAHSLTGVVFSGILMALFISVSALLLRLWSAGCVGQLILPGGGSAAVWYGLFVLLAFAVTALFLLAAHLCCVILFSGAGLSEYGKAALYSLKSAAGQPRFFLFCSAVLFLSLLGYYAAGDAVQAALGRILPAVFLSRFVDYLIFSVLRAVLASMVFYMCGRLEAKSGSGFRTSGPGGKKSLPVFALVTAALSAAAFFFALPGSLRGPDTLLSNIEFRIAKADLLISEGNNRQAIYEFTAAEADLDSLSKYVQKLLAEKGASADAPAYGISSKHIFAACAYDDYFNVLLAADSGQEDYDPGRLSEHAGLIPECAVWAYGSYRDRGMTERALEQFNIVVMQGMYTDRFLGTKNDSVTRLNDLLERAAALQAELNRRKVYEFMERAEYEDRKALLEEVGHFIDENGASPDLYAFAASLAAQTAQGDTEYERMREYSLAYFGSADFESREELISAVRFVTFLLYRSRNFGEAVSFAEQRHAEYPEEAEITLIYANALMENREHERSSEVLLPLGDDLIYKDYLMAINCLELGEFVPSLEHVSRLEAALAGPQEDGETADRIDFYLYGYLLECISYFERDDDTSGSVRFGEKAAAFLTAVQAQSDASLAYRCILGLRDWYAQDYDGSNRLFEQVMEQYPALNFPYLMIGVNDLEKAEVEGADCYPLAEYYLLQYIERRPDAEEAYYCLAHIYKHSGQSVQAKRAFQKVTTLLPYYNYDYDIWGIGYHARENALALKGEES